MLDQDEEGKRAFFEKFKEAATQFNRVQQYYEYEWNDETFGMSEHTWKQYQGAAKNLRNNGVEIIDILVNPLPGRTKIAGTQIIDANHIIQLIKKKLVVENGIQTIDAETLRICYEQIQELSDMGDDIQAQLLKRFVDEELITGKIAGNVDIDDAFVEWKNSIVNVEVSTFAQEWGLDQRLLLKSVEEYSYNDPEVIPYLTDIVKTLDFSKATNKSAGNMLKHNMMLHKALPTWMKKVKQLYH